MIFVVRFQLAVSEPTKVLTNQNPLKSEKKKKNTVKESGLDDQLNATRDLEMQLCCCLMLCSRVVLVKIIVL